MAQISRQVGTTSQVTLLFVQDSSSTTGAGLTGLAHNTGSLTAYYKRSNGTASVAITLANITTLGTYVSGGFKEVDATNLPGIYEFHPPNAALASGADSVAILLKGAANMAPCPLIIELTGTSNQDAVRGGMTALPNAVAAASGGLLTYGTSTGQLNPSSGKIPATLASTDVTGNVAADLQTIKTQTVTCSGGVTVPAATLASTTNITAGTITTATNVTTVNGFAAGAITAASIAVSALDNKGNWNVGKTGYSLTATTGLGNQTANITGNLSGSVGSVTGNVGGNVTGSVGSVTGLTDATIADAVWDEILSGHAGVGSAGAALSAAGGSGDPWSTALPGAYGAGTAGYIVGTNLDALISSRMATYTQPTGFLAATFPTTVASPTNITAASGVSLASAGLDAIVIETGINARQAISIIAAANAGLASGNDTNSPVFKGINTNTTRITATTTAAGNRTAVTLSPPA